MRISYSVRLDHDPEGWPGGIDGAAFTTDWGVFFTGRSVFVVPVGAGESIEVAFRAPPTWHASTPWTPVAGRAGTFSLGGDTALTESIVFVGEHRNFTTERGGFELATPGEQTSRILVVINEGEKTDGEVIGSHINMVLSPDPDPMGEMFSRFGLAHELFHLWNGKSIRHDGLEDWFSEGFTNFYTLKALHRVGGLDEVAWFTVLDKLFFQRYRADEGTGVMSMREAVEEKDARWGLIYGGGFFVALCQDVEIRLATGNRASVDDLMREMFERYGGSPDTYGAAEVARLASRLSGSEQEGFFDRHVLGVEPVPVDACLARAGLEAAVEDGHLRLRRPEEMSAEGAAVIDGLLGG